MADEKRPREEEPRRSAAGGSSARGPRDGQKKPYAKHDGDRKPYAPRDGERKSYPPRDGERRPYTPRDGEKRSYPPRDGERKSYPPRDGERRPYTPRDGEKRSYPPRDGERKSYPPRDGERRPYTARDGEKRSYPPRDGERKSYLPRDGERRSFSPRDGDRKPYANRDGDRNNYAPRDGDRRTSRPPQGDDRRTGPSGPALPDDVTPQDLNGGARNELKTLSKENAEQVARHLAMAARLIDDDPALAHEHALAASRSAGRIAIVRETVAITAYAVGDFALAVRELRTFRRISGKDDQIALLVDSERGVGRPDRALEVGRAVDRASLPVDVRVELAIAMSGARLDLGENERALQELDIPELDPDRAFSWSAGLFAARAAVLEELGRHDEASEWQRRAQIAEAAIGEVDADLETIIVDEIEELVVDDDLDDLPEAVESVDNGSSDDLVDEAAGDALAVDAPSQPAPSVQDEVDEILAEAGVSDDEDEDEDDETER